MYIMPGSLQQGWFSHGWLLRLIQNILSNIDNFFCKMSIYKHVIKRYKLLFDSYYRIIDSFPTILKLKDSD